MWEKKRRTGHRRMKTSECAKQVTAARQSVTQTPFTLRIYISMNLNRPLATAIMTPPFISPSALPSSHPHRALLHSILSSLLSPRHTAFSIVLHTGSSRYPHLPFAVLYHITITGCRSFFYSILFTAFSRHFKPFVTVLYLRNPLRPSFPSY